MSATSTLESLRVLVFGDCLPSAVAGSHLGLLGADVVLLEPGDGCWLRRGDLARHPRVLPLWSSYGRGLRSAVTHSDQDTLDFIAASDVCIVAEPTANAISDDESFPSPAKGRVLLTQGAMASDLLTQAASGMLSYVGQSDRQPIRIGFEVVGITTGVAAVQAAVALTLGERGGTIKVDAFKIAVNLISNQVVSQSHPEERTSFAAYHTAPPEYGFPAQDGWVEVIFFYEDQGFAAFCSEIGAPELAARPKFADYTLRSANRAELAEALSPFCRCVPAERLVAMATRHGAFAMVKAELRDALRREQVAANGLVSSDHDDLLAGPWTIDGHRPILRGLPELAQHDEEIRRDWFEPGTTS